MLPSPSSLIEKLNHAPSGTSVTSGYLSDADPLCACLTTTRIVPAE